MALKGNALIGQSGGPTIVINGSVIGAVEAAEKYAEIEHFYGASHGISGILNEEMFDLFREDDDVLRAMRYTPSAALGSCRLKPKAPDLERAMEVFKAHDIRYFFYNGGNDSQLTCHLISELAKNSDWEMQVIGIPKTIDNDLVLTDNCPGFGSAARYAAWCVQTVARDAMAFGTAEVVEVMGRHAGWMTGATQCGRKEDWMAPHLVYLPEVEVDFDKFLNDAQNAYDAYGYLVVAVSEGLAFEQEDDASSAKKLDEFGHARLGGVAEALSDLIEEQIGVRCRNDRLGNLQRAFSPCMSKVDADEAFAVGEDAVNRAANGETDVMVTIERTNNSPFEFTTGTTSLMSVADQTRLVPEEWINDERNGVTDEFITYAEPLITGTAVQMSDALPLYPVFQKHFVEKKLQPYTR